MDVVLLDPTLQFLRKRNFSVSSLDNLSRKGSLFNLKLLRQSKIKNYKIDISNYKKIKKSLNLT